MTSCTCLPSSAVAVTSLSCMLLLYLWLPQKALQWDIMSLVNLHHTKVKRISNSAPSLSVCLHLCKASG